MYRPDFETFCNLAKKANFIPVYKEFLADIETPVTAYLKLKDKGYSFLLESAEGGEKWGRYSFIGCTPILIITYQDERVKISGPEGKDIYERVNDPLPLLRETLKEFHLAQLSDLPRFQGGLIGYFSYDIVRCFERLPNISIKDLSIPEAIFVLPKTLIIFDHVKHTVKIVSFVDLRKERGLKKAYEGAISSIEKNILQLRSPLNYGSKAISISTISSNFSKESFMSAVDRIRSYIFSGDAIQVVLSQRLSTKIDGDDFSIYRALRSINPSPYMFYLNFDKLKLIGSSPEILVRLEGDLITLRPIAGTRPRGRDENEDLALEEELLNDPKERAEHIMLVDLGRNDVGRVSRPGTVRVTDLMVIERYSHVMHIVSNVTGRLQEGRDAFDVLKACFPAGTVSGAPKIRAMEIIEEFEPTRRGPYAGAVGYFSLSGDMDFCITIRTVVVWEDMLHVQVGAGIVADSVPEREYEETMNKAKAMLKAINWTVNGLL
ncbi:MAG: anthranilate synthase component I [Deltaproteobacteria bacterium]|nr:anthranilate synthase component I [Deltaproteobacteria bacterium]